MSAPSAKGQGSVLIVHPELGVYIGSAMGMGFWSKLDPVGQPVAVTFPSEADARAFTESWGDVLHGLSFLPVVPDMGEYASIAACIAAGAEGWIDDIMPVANERPI